MLAPAPSTGPCNEALVRSPPPVMPLHFPVPPKKAKVSLADPALPVFSQDTYILSPSGRVDVQNPDSFNSP